MSRRREPLNGITIRAALLIGFGLTFGLWLFTGYQFTLRMAEVGQQAATVNLRYMQAQEMLSTVRAQILLASVYVRDALLDPASAAESRQEVVAITNKVDTSLAQYVPVLDAPRERDRVTRLRSEIRDFHDTMMSVLGSSNLNDNTPESRRNARLVLRSLVVPRRESVMRLSEDVQALNRAAFVQQQADTADLYRTTQQQIWWLVGVALAISIAIGVFATVYSGRLEHRLKQQHEREAENAQDLQRLSARLITAQEEERRNIARELHDEVGQVLTAVKVELSIARRSLESNGASARILDDVQSITDGALNTVRDLSHLLHPSLLDDLGLPAAIDWYLRGFGRRHDLRVELLHEGMERRLRRDAEANIYRIVQEALTNVAKHAQASVCRVYLQRLPSTVLITIEDDGRGFDSVDIERAGTQRGLGLIGIRERVCQLQGTLRLETGPGRGTRVTIEAPAVTMTPSTTAGDLPDEPLREAVGG